MGTCHYRFEKRTAYCAEKQYAVLFNVYDSTMLLHDQIGQPQTDLRNKRDQDQRNDHAKIEWKGRLDHLLNGKLRNSGADEQNASYRRCQKSDTAVKDDHDTELDRFNADALCDGEQDRRSDQDDRSQSTRWKGCRYNRPGPSIRLSM